jgi:hypothetical protein
MLKFWIFYCLICKINDYISAGIYIRSDAQIFNANILETDIEILPFIEVEINLINFRGNMHVDKKKKTLNKEKNQN